MVALDAVSSRARTLILITSWNNYLRFPIDFSLGTDGCQWKAAQGSPGETQGLRSLGTLEVTGLPHFHHKPSLNHPPPHNLQVCVMLLSAPPLSLEGDPFSEAEQMRTSLL